MKKQIYRKVITSKNDENCEERTTVKSYLKDSDRTKNGMTRRHGYWKSKDKNIPTGENTKFKFWVISMECSIIGKKCSLSELRERMSKYQEDGRE